jgi:hypothetical protein
MKRESSKLSRPSFYCGARFETGGTSSICTHALFWPTEWRWFNRSMKYQHGEADVLMNAVCMYVVCLCVHTDYAVMLNKPWTIQLQVWYTERFLLCQPIHDSALHGNWYRQLRGAYEFCQWISMLMADKVWNWGKLLTLWTLDGIMFHGKQCGSCAQICLSFIISGRQLSASFTVCSQLQLVSSVFHHGAVYFRATCISVCHLREIQIC